MNIERLLTQLIKQAQGQKSLELVAGQVVRATIRQLLPDQQAILNIQGSIVKARLEVPLSKGQSAWLQVQPESTAKQMILKPVNLLPSHIPDEAAPNTLQELGLMDNKQNRELLQALMRQQSQVPVPMEDIQKAISAFSEKPANISTEAWLKASFLALGKALPLSKSIVLPLVQATDNGHASLHAQMGQLAGEITKALEMNGLSSSGHSIMASSSSEKLLVQTQAMMNTIMDLSLEPNSSSNFSGSFQDPVSTLPFQSSTQTSADRSNAMQFKAAETALRDASSITQGLPQAQVLSHDKPASEEAVHSSVKNSGGEPVSSQSAKWVVSLLKSLGMNYEHGIRESLGSNALQENDAQVQHGRAETQIDSPASAIQGQQPANVKSTSDMNGSLTSLKGLLLQLSHASELPGSLQQTASQLLGTLTGQQLLMAPGDAGAFVNLTLQLPLFQGAHAQTASVHIQARKKARGRLDAENCSLFFDLDMKHLGMTFLDVQIYDRNVQMKIYNNHSGRSVVASAIQKGLQPILQQMNYRLVSCTSQDLPETKEQEKRSTQAQAPAYKGVDMRI